MRLKLISDLHMEGFQFVYEFSGEDVIVLAGDNHTRYRHAEIIKQIPEHVKVLITLGNHESYHIAYEDSVAFMRGLESCFSNVTFLDCQSVEFDGVSFYGGMMCTDFSLDGEYDVERAKSDANRGIADFYRIKRITSEKPLAHRLWTPDDHVEEFRKYTKGLDFWLKQSEGMVRVAISHFAPHPQTIAPQFLGSGLNPYFTVNMDRYMGLVDYWLFGHVHSNHNLNINGTRVISNCKGYGTECEDFDPKKIIEITP